MAGGVAGFEPRRARNGLFDERRVELGFVGEGANVVVGGSRAVLDKARDVSGMRVSVLNSTRDPFNGEGQSRERWVQAVCMRT